MDRIKKKKDGVDEDGEKIMWEGIVDKGEGLGIEEDLERKIR